MAEWTKAVDSKSTVPQGTGGSNPSLSASLAVHRVRRGARAVESARLESAWTPKVSRGFESHPLRSMLSADRRLDAPSRNRCRHGTLVVMIVLGGEVAVSCSPQSAIAGLNSLVEALASRV